VLDSNAQALARTVNASALLSPEFFPVGIVGIQPDRMSPQP